MESSNTIIIKGLYKRFPVGKGEFTALSDINLNFEQGEFTGLIGPSGSGKTTLLNILGSLDVPSAGEALVLGNSIGMLSAREAANLRKVSLGFIFQSYNLLAVHTVYENVEFPLLLLKLSATERHKMVMDALEWVGLTDKIKSKPPQLSGGQCQRVAIARAMVKKPSLVLADEPTANLDAANSHHILKTMETLNRELKTTFIFATHDDKVISYLRRKVFLLDGRIDKDEIIHPNS
ncbi:MAG: lipoprotein-releasing system ATP-binding protein LolD [Bacteroidetes bacterium HGW-Bacteroidetes-11]|jgi:putative ABC transport system ATP-binding protein|nr:MAG: lipoprotein-releasing system ATP-binding protein LolD [Bacteroidetes bacterium HGW-Bacteroidetes-11]